MKRHITNKEATGQDGDKKGDEAKKSKEEQVQDDDNGLADIVEFDMEKHRMNRGKEDVETGKEDDKNDEQSQQKWEEKQKEYLGQDVQVQAAVNMINLLSVERKCDPEHVASRQAAVQFLKQNFLTDEKGEIEKVK
jgi:hypothetical protein